MCYLDIFNSIFFQSSVSKISLRFYQYHRTLLLECKRNHSEEPMVGLAALLEGAASFYLGDTEAAIKSYRNCLKQRHPSKDEYDQHVSAFALYELGNNLCNNNVSMLNVYLLLNSFYNIANFYLFLFYFYTFSYFRIPTKAKVFY